MEGVNRDAGAALGPNTPQNRNWVRRMRSDIHCVIVSGPSGVGKSTVAGKLATVIGLPLVEADDYHPASNRRKMAAGLPLEDADRVPWLDALASAISAQRCVVACSALKSQYRSRLREVGQTVVFIQLEAPIELLRDRVGARVGHFVPVSLVASQMDDLEPLAPDENGARIDASRPIDLVLKDVLRVIA